MACLQCIFHSWKITEKTTNAGCNRFFHSKVSQKIFRFQFSFFFLFCQLPHFKRTNSWLRIIQREKDWERECIICIRIGTKACARHSLSHTICLFFWKIGRRSWKTEKGSTQNWFLRLNCFDKLRFGLALHCTTNANAVSSCLLFELQSNRLSRSEPKFFFEMFLFYWHYKYVL